MLRISEDLWQAPLQTCWSPEDSRRIAQESRDHVDRMFGIVNAIIGNGNNYSSGNGNNYSKISQESNTSIETTPISNRDEKEVCTIMPYVAVLWYI